MSLHTHMDDNVVNIVVFHNGVLETILPGRYNRMLSRSIILPVIIVIVAGVFQLAFFRKGIIRDCVHSIGNSLAFEMVDMGLDIYGPPFF